jgi:hypothetical protein
VTADNRGVKAVLAAVILATAFAASGCGGSGSPMPAGASFAPASAAAFVSVDSDLASAQWKYADELSHRFPGRRDAVDSAESSIRSGSGLDFAKDVKPALGPELDFVWLDLDHGGSDVVALMQPKDETAFDRAVAKGNAQDPSSPLLHEQVDGWEVMAPKQSTIDAFKRSHAAGGPVLAHDDSFEQAMHEYADDALVKAYVSGARIEDEVNANVPASQRKSVHQLGSLDWLASSVRTSADGVRLDATARGRAGKLLRSSNGAGGSGFELSLPKQLPANVLAYLGFRGTAGALDGLAGNPALASPQFKPVRTIVRRVGRLLDGENALYLRPGKGRLPELTLVAVPAAATDGATTLDGILQDAKLGDRISPSQVAGVQARELGLGGGVKLVYANVGGKLVVTDRPEGIAAVAKPGASLSGAAAFHDATSTAGLPKNVSSFFYVDVRGGLGLVQKLSGAPIPRSVKRNLGPLRSAVEYAASRPSEVQVTFFVRIT